MATYGVNMMRNPKAENGTLDNWTNTNVTISSMLDDNCFNLVAGSELRQTAVPANQTTLKYFFKTDYRVLSQEAASLAVKASVTLTLIFHGGMTKNVVVPLLWRVSQARVQTIEHEIELDEGSLDLFTVEVKFNVDESAASAYQVTNVYFGNVIGDDDAEDISVNEHFIEYGLIPYHGSADLTTTFNFANVYADLPAFNAFIQLDPTTNVFSESIRIFAEPVFDAVVGGYTGGTVRVYRDGAERSFYISVSAICTSPITNAPEGE